MPSPTADGDDTGDGIQDSDGDGMIDSKDYAPRDPDVQEESDVRDASSEQVPGFGVGATVVALTFAAFAAHRRS
jgi:PGF-CTERM protein